MQVRRPTRVSGGGGASFSFFATGDPDTYTPKIPFMDASCTQLVKGADWKECYNEAPYDRAKIFAKIEEWDSSAQAYPYYVSHQVISYLDDRKLVNITAYGLLTQKDRYQWDPTGCLQAKVISKEYM